MYNFNVESAFENFKLFLPCQINLYTDYAKETMACLQQVYLGISAQSQFAKRQL